MTNRENVLIKSGGVVQDEDENREIYFGGKKTKRNETKQNKTSQRETSKQQNKTQNRYS